MFVYLCSRIKVQEMIESQNMSKARKRKFYLKLSDFLLDLAKLIFGGIILTGILDMDFNKPLLFLTGSIVVAILAIWGFVLFNRGTKTN